jgi:hypothetical protein
MNANQSPIRVQFLALCAAGLFAVSAPAAMAAKTGKAPVDAQYKADVAACNSGQTQESHSVCLQEAGAAHVERMRNQLAVPDQDYQANATLRCRALPPTEQEACVAQMSGQGKTYGSVNGGGVLREITIQVPVDQNGQPVGSGQPVSPPAGGYQTPPASGGYQAAPPSSAPMNVPGTGTGLRY